MTPDRFVQLLDAYGADIARWPAAERAAAQALARAAPAALQAAQDEAAALDALLATHSVAPPEPALAAHIALQAGTAPSGRWWRTLTRWPAWAAVGLAGAATGVFAATLALHAGPPAADTWNDMADAFGGRRAEWSEE